MEPAVPWLMGLCEGSELDCVVMRTNKNAGISVITGLAFVAFAGLCITYQD